MAASRPQRSAARAASAVLRRAYHQRRSDQPASRECAPILSMTIRDGMLFGRSAIPTCNGLAAAMGDRGRSFVTAHPGHRGLHRLPDHQRRGRPFGRHQARGRDAGGPPGTHRLLPGRRAVEREADRRHDQVGRRGSLSGATVHGVQGHVAYPQLAENPCMRWRRRWREMTAPQVGLRKRILPADDVPGSRNLNAGTGAPERDPWG